jgi:hypothetical protein
MLIKNTDPVDTKSPLNACGFLDPDICLKDSPNLIYIYTGMPAFFDSSTNSTDKQNSFQRVD